MEISWGLSKPLQEANLSWLPQETWALTLLASNKPDAEWTSTWPFVNPETPEKASGQHHTHQDPKESKHLERCQGKGKEGERKSRKAGSQSDEASSICVWILVSGAIVCWPDQTKCSVWKKKMASTESKWHLLSRAQRMRTPLCVYSAKRREQMSDFSIKKKGKQIPVHREHISLT